MLQLCPVPLGRRWPQMLPELPSRTPTDPWWRRTSSHRHSNRHWERHKVREWQGSFACWRL